MTKSKDAGGQPIGSARAQTAEGTRYGKRPKQTTKKHAKSPQKAQ